MDIPLPEIAADEAYQRLNSVDSHYTDCSESNYSDWDEDYYNYNDGEEVCACGYSEFQKFDLWWFAVITR